MSIAPVGDAQTYVNGQQISEPTVLHHVSRPGPGVRRRVLRAGLSVSSRPSLERPLPDRSPVPSHKPRHCDGPR